MAAAERGRVNKLEDLIVSLGRVTGLEIEDHPEIAILIVLARQLVKELDEFREQDREGFDELAGAIEEEA